MNIETSLLRIEQIKQWIDKNKEYLCHALITDKTELTISMKGSSVRCKVTQFPDEEK